MSSKTELFFMVILIIVISSFIGLNIIRIVDNKLSKISIKMPKVVVPPANIIVKVQKENGKYEVYSDDSKKDVCHEDKNKIYPEEKKTVETFRSSKQREHIEKSNDIRNLRPYNFNDY